MALGFFRRRQKMVIIIMVVLMVAFLVPSGLSSLNFFSRGGGAMGTTRMGEVSSEYVRRAQNTLGVLELSPLRNILWILKNRIRTQIPQEALVYAGPYDQITSNEANTVRTMTLLIYEAQKHGVSVDSAQVEAFKQAVGLTGEAYDRFLEDLHGKRFSTSQVEKAFKDWLAVCDYWQANAYDLPPSTAEMELQFKSLAEQISLDMVIVPADEFMDKVPTPTQEEIVKQFESNLQNPPGLVTSITSYGVGYLLPDRVQLSYLFLNQQVLQDVAQPTEEAAVRYWEAPENKQQKIPLPTTDAASAPAATTTSAPALPEVALGQVPFGQAKPVILNLLKPEVAEVTMNSLLRAIDQIETQLVPPDGTAPANLYDQMFARLTVDASTKLSTVIHTNIVAMPLKDALVALAKDAGLKQIYFPTGRVGKWKLDDDTKVTVRPLSGDTMTLREALNQVVSQLNVYTVSQWVMFRDIADVLFAIPPTEPGSNLQSQFLPVSVCHTGLMDAKALNEDDILGSAYTSQDFNPQQQQQQPERLIVLAFSAEPFKRPGVNNPLRVGQRCPLTMYVEGQSAVGRLVWTVDRALPERPPTWADYEQDAGLRERVIRDAKIPKALDMAQQAAEAIQQAAATEGLAKAAQAAGRQSKATKLFTRRMQDPRTGAWVWSDLPGLGLTQQLLRQYAIQQAFGLVPADVEPREGGYGLSEVRMLRLPAKQEVVLIQRTEYQPVVRSNYLAAKPALTRFYRDMRYRLSAQQWLSWQGVQSRLDYKEKAR